MSNAVFTYSQNFHGSNTSVWNTAKEIKHHLQVQSLEELLERFGSRSSALPAVSDDVHWSRLLSQDVHVDELKAAHFAIQHACPYAHGRFTDDIDQVSGLRTTEYLEVIKTVT